MGLLRRDGDSDSEEVPEDEDSGKVDVEALVKKRMGKFANGDSVYDESMVGVYRDGRGPPRENVGKRLTFGQGAAGKLAHMSN